MSKNTDCENCLICKSHKIICWYFTKSHKLAHKPLDRRALLKNYFSYMSYKTYVVGQNKGESSKFPKS